MGNVETHDAIDTPDTRNRSLDISRHVNHKQFIKHINNDIAWENIHTEVPVALCDAVSLYEEINASFNAISEIPAELPLRLPHLTHINISYNKITSLPVNFALFFHLDTLLINNNDLRELPESFCHLAMLTKLDLSNNCLRELPTNLGGLPLLCSLNVNNNKLKKLPLSLGGSNALSVFLAKGNRLIEPPQSVVNEGSDETIQYLRQHYVRPSPERTISVKSGDNVFQRVRGSQFAQSVANAHSAHTLYAESQTDMFMQNRMKAPLLPPSHATTLDVDELSDRIIGLIYGAIVGDAVGIATALMDSDQCRFHYGQHSTLHYSDIIRDEHRVHWRPGDWTVHGDMLLLVMECILQWGGVVDELDFASRILEWKRTGFVELGDHSGFDAGHIITEVVSCAEFATNPHEAADEAWKKLSAQSKGRAAKVDNLALTRSLILGIPHFEELKEVSSNALRICKSTHYSDLAVGGALFVTVLVALTLQGKHCIEADRVELLIKEAEAIAVKYLTDENDKEKLHDAVNAEKFHSLDLCELGFENSLLKTIAASMIAVRNYTSDFKKSITSLIMLGGDSPGYASLAGGLIGCLYGFKQIPPVWTEELRPRQKQFLDLRINHLLDMMGIP